MAMITSETAEALFEKTLSVTELQHCAVDVQEMLGNDSPLLGAPKPL